METPVGNLDKGRDMEASKLRTGCGELAKRSYACLEKNQDNNAACQSFFEAYKECRKNEHDALIAERRKRFA